MVRGKTQIKRIENTSSRQVSFSKRRSGLLKKAFELSVLCEAEVALMVFSPTGKLYEFSSSSSINQIIERYKKNANNPRAGKTPTAAEENTQHLQEEAEIMTKKMEHLEECKRRLLGVGLEAYTADELQETETHLEQSIRKIRARKSQLLGQKIQELKEEERRLTNENAKLHMERELQTLSLNIGCQGAPATRELADVETELLIGPPARRWTRH